MIDTLWKNGLSHPWHEKCPRKLNKEPSQFLRKRSTVPIGKKVVVAAVDSELDETAVAVGADPWQVAVVDVVVEDGALGGGRGVDSDGPSAPEGAGAAAQEALDEPHSADADRLLPEHRRRDRARRAIDRGPVAVDEGLVRLVLGRVGPHAVLEYHVSIFFIAHLFGGG